MPVLMQPSGYWITLWPLLLGIVIGFVLGYLVGRVRRRRSVI